MWCGGRMWTVPPTIAVKNELPVAPEASIRAALRRGRISRSPADVSMPCGAVTVMGIWLVLFLELHGLCFELAMFRIDCCVIRKRRVNRFRNDRYGKHGK